MKKSLYAVLIGFVIVFSGVPCLQAGIIDPQLETRLQALDPGHEIDVIVVLTEQVKLDKIKQKDKAKRRYETITALKSLADKAQKPIKDFLKAKKANKIEPFYIFNGLAATIRADAIEELAALPGVDSISLDDTLEIPVTTSTNSLQPAWNVNATRAPEMWAMGFTGSGVVIAGMDTGVDVNHPDLAAKWRGGNNSWFDPNGEHATPYDMDGHGTQTMGVMVGGDASGTAIGIAPDAQWIAVKIYDDAGSASFSDIHLGFQWLLDPDGDPGTNDSPDVINNSWGLRNNVDGCITEFQSDIQVLKAAEIAVVFAAGNEGPYPYTSISPANYPESMAVGSVDAVFAVQNTSSRGPSACDDSIYPEVVAPGVNITTPNLTYGGLFPDSYATVSGTSFAAPHVAGAMALLHGADPQTTVANLETSLAQAAVDLGTAGPDHDYGNGFIDVMEAYLLLSQAQPPTCTDDDGDGFYTTADCGAPVDCDDADPGVFPGAVEIKHDGVDQDCNGFDLTIEITSAVYLAAGDSLNITATSALGADAGLELVGYGAMKWNRKKKIWSATISGAGGDPSTVTVSGFEGSESTQTTVDNGAGGGNSGGGKGNGKNK
jgi:serine protease AprX